MHRLLERYITRVWSEARARRDEAALLAMLVLKKRALSSARSLATSVARRLERLGSLEPDSRAQLPLPLGSDHDEVDRADEEPSDVLTPLGPWQPRSRAGVAGHDPRGGRRCGARRKQAVLPPALAEAGRGTGDRLHRIP